MTAILYALLLSLGLITSAEDFDNASTEDQQEMLIIVEDQTNL